MISQLLMSFKNECSFHSWSQELATPPPSLPPSLPPKRINFLGLLTKKPPGFPKQLGCSGKMDSSMMKFIVMREGSHLWAFTSLL
jgi:hypothetical protein